LVLKAVRITNIFGRGAIEKANGRETCTWHLRLNRTHHTEQRPSNRRHTWRNPFSRWLDPSSKSDTRSPTNTKHFTNDAL